MGAANPVCGEEFGISAMIANVPPYELGAAAVFTATSSDPSHVWLIRQEQGMDAFATEFIFRAAEDWEGTVTICVKASLKGRLQQEYVVPIPADYRGGLRLEEAFRIKPVSEVMYSGLFSLRTAQGKQVSQGTSLLFSGATNLLNLHMAAQSGKEVSGPFKTTFQGRTWDCGCNDLIVTCEMCDDSEIAWDDPTSADTIVRNGSATVAITDSVGKGGPYSWSVSGTGFSLANATTEGLANTLYAGGTACGTATITVTGCNGKVVTGYVRCTTGVWVTVASCNSPSGCSRVLTTVGTYQLISNKKRVNEIVSAYLKTYIGACQAAPCIKAYPCQCSALNCQCACDPKRTTVVNEELYNICGVNEYTEQDWQCA